MKLNVEQYFALSEDSRHLIDQWLRHNDLLGLGVIELTWSEYQPNHVMVCHLDMDRRAQSSAEGIMGDSMDIPTVMAPRVTTPMPMLPELAEAEQSEREQRLADQASGIQRLKIRRDERQEQRDRERDRRDRLRR